MPQVTILSKDRIRYAVLYDAIIKHIPVVRRYFSSHPIVETNKSTSVEYYNVSSKVRPGIYELNLCVFDPLKRPFILGIKTTVKLNAIMSNVIVSSECIRRAGSTEPVLAVTIKKGNPPANIGIRYVQEYPMVQSVLEFGTVR